MEPQLYVCRNNEGKPSPSKVLLVKNGYVKPREGGLWTSTYDPDYGSAWVDWCKSRGVVDFPQQCYLLRPSADARVYAVASLHDLEALLNSYRIRSLKAYPDFEAMSKDFDGMHLTVEGERATRLSEPHDLCGWSCESTLWFRWAFSEVKDIVVA